MSPLTITVDYERALLDACTEVYPATKLQGCFFSFQPMHKQSYTIKWPQEKI